MNDYLVHRLRSMVPQSPMAPTTFFAPHGTADRIEALEAERDKWHQGWMEAEAKVSELETERDALKAEVKRLRGAFRVNMIRFAPDVSHADIDDLLERAALQENTDE